MLHERFRFRAMGSPCRLDLYAPDRETLERGADAACRELARLEKKYSRYRPDSLASRINRSAGAACGVHVDDETAALLDFAATAHEESEGRFDPTSGVLREVWDFRSGRVPDASAVDAKRRLVGWSKIRWERPLIALPVIGMELDFGGFVKEYAADRLAERLRQEGLAHGLVDLGGDMAVVGPHPDGSPWLVGIRDPRAPERAIARIALPAGGLATSGDYERCMVVDGQRYSHLLDPRTGWSFQGGPACVSVRADHCLIAGVSATIAMLHAEAEAGGFLERLGLPHLGIAQGGRIFGETKPLPISPRRPAQVERARAVGRR